MRRLLRAVTLVTLTGCGYASQYRPPADGRARPLWRGDHVENDVPQLPISRACRDAIFLTAHADAPRSTGRATGFWIPPPAPPVTRLADGAADDESEVDVAQDFVDPFLMRGVVAMVLLLPIVDIVIAAERPEGEPLSAEAIDEVNAYNDLVRRPGTACSQRSP